ncbi:MAG: cysteine desulfuration protein SufE [Rhodothermales bacterium]|jgi:cysteine desulfuration protein SufE
MTAVATIGERADEVVEEFELFDDWMERYEHLIEQGKALPALPEAFRDDAYKVRGCQSQVWVAAEPTDHATIQFWADSDAIITRGIVALLVRVLNDQPPAAVAETDLAFLDRIGMKEHLSPTRKNGLDAMVRRMKLYAEALASA